LDVNLNIIARTLQQFIAGNLGLFKINAGCPHIILRVADYQSGLVACLGSHALRQNRYQRPEYDK
jgi:hypothetical protein